MDLSLVQVYMYTLYTPCITLITREIIMNTSKATKVAKRLANAVGNKLWIIGTSGALILIVFLDKDIVDLYMSYDLSNQSK